MTEQSTRYSLLDAPCYQVGTCAARPQTEGGPLYSILRGRRGCLQLDPAEVPSDGQLIRNHNEAGLPLTRGVS